jgi:acyl-CoA thioester hydrolase
MSEAGVEVWRGGVKAFQIDEMGHLNVRFYVAIAMEGLAGLAAELGLAGAFRPAAEASLIVREHHIRFLREARSRAPLHMTAGVLEMGESDARVLFTLWHSISGEPAATFNTVIAHVTAKEGRAFPWPSATKGRAEALRIELPAYAASKSVPLEPATSQASLERADTLGLKRIAAGAIRPQDCDAFGRMHAELFMDFIVGGIPQFGGAFRETVVEHADQTPGRAGNAALEYRLLYLDYPRAGDLWEMRTGALAYDRRGQNVIHWLLDPLSGRAFGACQAYITTFDLEARKIIPISDAAMAILNRGLIEGAAL